MIYRVAGGFYHNYENAYDAARKLVTKDDIYEYIQASLSGRDLFNWCFQNDAFLEQFKEEILDAEQIAIDDLYVQEVELYDDEEEEEFAAKVEFLDEE